MVDRVEAKGLVATRDNTQDRNWIVIDQTSGQKVQVLASRWQQDQVEVMLLLIARHHARGYEEGFMKGNLEGVNGIRRALLLDPLTEV